MADGIEPGSPWRSPTKLRHACSRRYWSGQRHAAASGQPDQQRHADQAAVGTRSPPHLKSWEANFPHTHDPKIKAANTIHRACISHSIQHKIAERVYDLLAPRLELCGMGCKAPIPAAIAAIGDSRRETARKAPQGSKSGDFCALGRRCKRRKPSPRLIGALQA